MSQQILDKLKQAIETFDCAAAEAAAKEAVAAKMDAITCIDKGLAAGMATISDLFDEGEAFVPQLIIAAQAFDKAIKVLTETMSDEQKAQSSRGKVLIHTVQGDIHSIGKNICATMLNASGFEVIDMGCDVPVEDVVDKAEELKVDIIAGSALMTTTMPAMKEIVNLLKERGIADKYLTMFGGAPVDEDWVKSFGADGYADTATGCVRLATKMMDEKHKKGA